MTQIHQICLKIRKKIRFFEKTVINIDFRRLVWKDKLKISKLQIIFYNNELWSNKIWAQNDKKHIFFSKNRPWKSIFKEIRAQTMKYMAN